MTIAIPIIAIQRLARDTKKLIARNVMMKFILA